MLHFMLLVRSFNHLSIGAMYEQGPMIFICREITLTASCFDGKRQLLDSLSSKFPGGTMNLESHVSNSMILTYWQSLLKDYRNVFNETDDATARVVYGTSHFGHQNIPNSNNYWFLEPGVSIQCILLFVFKDNSRVSVF